MNDVNKRPMYMGHVNGTRSLLCLLGYVGKVTCKNLIRFLGFTWAYVLFYTYFQPTTPIGRRGSPSLTL